MMRKVLVLLFVAASLAGCQSLYTVRVRLLEHKCSSMQAALQLVVDQDGNAHGVCYR